MQYSLEDNISIIDKNTNNIIVAGKISYIKDTISYYKRYMYFIHKKVKENVTYVSFDSKYFFNVNSKRFVIKKSNDIKNFDVTTLDNYKYYHYRSAKTSTADIYIENTTDELDKEVVRLVHILNKIPNVMTSGSCSGHNIKPLWVSMTFRDIKSIKFIANLLYNKFCDKFVLSTKNNRSQTTPDGVELCIISLNKGKKAYKDTEDLCNSLEVYINTLYNN